MTFGFGPEELDAVRISLLVSTVGTLAALPFGIPVAYALARWRFPGKTLLDGLVHLPLVLPPVVTGYLLLILLGRRGPLGALLDQCCGIVFSFRWTGAAIAAAIMGFPLMVRAIRLSIEAVDTRLEQAAATLGAGRVGTFLAVTLPLAMPGLLAGTVLAYAKAFGEFGATITFVGNIPGETRTLPIAIYTFIETPGGDASALRLVVLAIAISLAALFLSELFNRRLVARLSG
jgi:molybdate transport system permease protein